MDKAAPLGHVVDHVKEQRQRAKEASKISSGVPSEIDEVIVDQIEDGSEQIKSSICCDDRPELFAEIGSALKALEATICVGTNEVDTGIIPFYTERLMLIGESRKPALSPLVTEQH
ncbi:hypothetical protein SASPL_157607 [Salvia splendens]|uniref:Uncharacterized protein n=1 Tax=Salvia splendens TaxID=180675 RepID=A0A8X8VUL7_SALSN|nr:hypothetical protein SASPL_157607 [Salvia splendens]